MRSTGSHRVFANPDFDKNGQHGDISAAAASVFILQVTFPDLAESESQSEEQQEKVDAFFAAGERLVINILQILNHLYL